MSKAKKYTADGKKAQPHSLSSVLFTIFLWAYAIFSLYPMLWMIMYSFKDNTEIFQTNPFGLPKVWRFENYVNAWQWMGYQFALIVAGIKSIGEDFYEAAEIDGATALKAHWHITLPLLKDTFNVCLLISLTGGIKAFSEIDIMTKGGPGTSTNPLTYIMYTHAFKRQNFGYGLTAASVLVLECLAIILVLNWLMKDRETPLFARRKGVDLL